MNRSKQSSSFFLMALHAWLLSPSWMATGWQRVSIVFPLAGNCYSDVVCKIISTW
jgi:hypothetical protein